MQKISEQQARQVHRHRLPAARPVRSSHPPLHCSGPSLRVELTTSKSTMPRRAHCVEKEATLLVPLGTP